MLFKEAPLPDRFARARGAGFDAVEIQFPYDTPLAKLAAARQDAGIPLDLINLPAGDFASGVRGIAGLPGREAEFRAGVERGLAYAAALGVRHVNVLAGIVPAGLAKDACIKTLVANLRVAAIALEPHGIGVLIEPINRHDIPDFLINTTAEALAVLDRVRHENVSVQADLYHMARMAEDHRAALAALGRRLGHVQFADVPGRREPGTGTLDFTALFAALDGLGYRGYAAAEYNPSKPTAETLRWLGRYRAAAPVP